MTSYSKNQDAIEKAESLIEAHQYELDSDWDDAEPSTEDENDMLDRDGWDEFGKWYLAIDEDASEETEDRYDFPYGDVRRLHRSGLVAARERAGQYDHDDIASAADDLLGKLDDVSSD